MCGRLNQTGTETWRDYIAAILIDGQRALPDLVNVAPTENLTLIHSGKAVAARWWLVPAWSDGPSQKYAMFNARCETLGKSPAFRGPFKSQRGVVPMSSFIEWRKSADTKQPWLIASDRGPLFAAALWDVWTGGDEPLLSCTIVTTAAAPAFAPWHQRMPVLLAEDELARWLDNERAIAADDPLFRPELKFDWQVAPLDKAAGNSRNKDARIMAPIGDAVELAA